MKLLALETSTIACSVALECGDSISERHEVAAQQHTKLLLPMIDDLLEEAGIGLQELDAIVLGNGPGSFIGMRIAASVAQGLCYGAGLKLVPVSSLEAIAAEAFQQEDVENVVVAQDAHMQEVYLAWFRRHESNGRPRPVGDAVLHPIAAIKAPEICDGLRWHAAGSGWTACPELLQLNAEQLAGIVAPELPRARYLLASGAAALSAGAAIDADRLVPDYVRSRVAELPGAPR